MWPKFKQLFCEYFFLVNIAVEAIKKLEETIYYQKSYTIKDYLDEFQTLVLEASYTNLYIIIVKFHQELCIVI